MSPPERMSRSTTGIPALKRCAATSSTETSSTGRDILRQLLDNAKLARDQHIPLCQDTGFAVVFVELGQEVTLTGGDLTESINEGVRRGYREGYLRNSIVADPFRRENTGDNTPAVVHVALVPGAPFGEDRCIRLSFATSMDQIDKGLDRIAKLLA